MFFAFEYAIRGSCFALALFLQLVDMTRQDVSEPVSIQDRARQTSIEFDRDILPILQNRCFECHAGSVTDGDLNLENEAAVRRGGHTGRRLIGDAAESSELFLRLVSTDKSYRMPKASDPLPADEIDLIRRWIDEGAVPSQPQPGQSAGRINSSTNTAESSYSPDGSLLERLGWKLHSLNLFLSQTRYRSLRLVGWTLLIWIAFSLLSLFGRRHVVKRTAALEENSAHQTRHVLLTSRLGHLFPSKKLLIAGFIGIAGVTVFLLQQGIITELTDELQVAQSKIRVQQTLVLTTDRKALTLPIHPSHPPRLGGLYYRGNDERSPELFNGGVYRTATMELWLVDQNRERLEWGSNIENRSLAIQLKVQRAPRTTGALFNEGIFYQTYLRRFRETDLRQPDGTDESEEIPFVPIDPSRLWEALVPLESTKQWKDGKNAGVAYLFYGNQMLDGFRGRVHYGIRYEIVIEDNKISDQSVLWMGSMYDLGGRVLVPQEREILLDHWFDYRPIPEIETDNPDDPELLGLPEHVDRNWFPVQ